MTSRGASARLADLEAERERLRAECTLLFDQKRAIEIQMQEIHERLQWLDDRIDGNAGDDGDVDDGSGPVMLTRPDEVSETHVTFEVDGAACSPCRAPLSSSATQPEEILTDPHTQHTQRDKVTADLSPAPLRDCGDGSGRRVSESPPETPRAGATRSATPPGRPRLAPANPYLKAPAGDRAGTAPNPFRDLRDPSAGATARGPSVKAGGPAVALAKYPLRRPPPDPAAGAPAPPCPRGGDAAGGGARHPWTERMRHHLRHTFGISQFRGHQEEIINTTMQGRDAFVVMRTGGGKSLTYQLPSVLESESQHKVSVVISPLVSLIRDQEMQMNKMRPGSALAFTSGMAGGNAEHARRWALVRDPAAAPHLALLFVTPEKVAKSTRFKGEMERLHGEGRLGRFVIDECHCACQWGHDFRPDYTKLGILKRHFPRVPVLAVTATASERVRHDCADILGLGHGYRFFRSTADRPNLRYSVQCKQDSKEGVVKDMAYFIKQNHVGEAGIIYTFSRKEADEVASKLCGHGIVARPYHSGVNDTRKDQIQRSWMRNKTQVVVATIAFGLGINKPNVRFVLHHSLSKSLEAYYQESGRAGRDGKPANCVLFYSPKDVTRMLGMIHGEAGEPTLWAMAKYGQEHGDDALCRHVILATLGEADNTVALDDLQKNCSTTVRRQIGAHCQTVTKVVHVLNMTGERATINQVVSKWRSKAADGPFDFLKTHPPDDLIKEECERIIVYLLCNDVLHPDVVYTPYSTIVYIILGPKGQNMLSSLNPIAEMGFPVRQKRKFSSSENNPVAATDEDGWISRQPAKKSKVTNTKSKKATSKSRAKAKKPKGSKKIIKKRTSITKMPKIVELKSSSSSSEDEDDVILARRRSVNRIRQTVIDPDTSDDSDYECSE